MTKHLGELTHHLMRSLEIVRDKSELALAEHFIGSALKIVRREHHKIALKDIASSPEN